MSVSWPKLVVGPPPEPAPRLNPVRALERIKADQTILQSPERMLELLRELDRDAYEAGLEHGRNEARSDIHECSDPDCQRHGGRR